MTDRNETGGEIGVGRFRIHHDDLGRVFGKLLAASVVSLWLSLVALVAVLLASSEENPTLTVTDFPVFVVIGSWVGIWTSLLGYSVWSFGQLRRLRAERTRQRGRLSLERVRRLLALAADNVDDPSPYEKRVKLTLQSLLFGLFFLVGVPVGVVYGSPPGG